MSALLLNDDETTIFLWIVRQLYDDRNFAYQGDMQTALCDYLFMLDPVRAMASTPEARKAFLQSLVVLDGLARGPENRYALGTTAEERITAATIPDEVRAYFGSGGISAGATIAELFDYVDETPSDLPGPLPQRLRDELITRFTAQLNGANRG